MVVAMLAVVLAVLGFAVHTGAYIPAVPTNNTNAVNQTDMSMLTMKWAPAGIYINTVSYQLASMDSDGFDEGALVHFSEKGLTDQNTTTPWIALVNCDANTTDASQVDDIFTLARDRGAVAALLYSTTAEACLINPEYASGEFEQILDIFATQSKSSAQIITSQFSNLRNSSFGNFDAAQLNESADSVAASMQSSNVTSAFIVATLRAANSTVSLNGTDSGNDSSSSSTASHNNPNTGLAMIILYAITGCVSGLFIIVILSGAIRAIRHPERYGPRAAGANGRGAGATGQSRTGGIGRAILDTFPIIKFGQGTPETATEPKRSDVENQAAADRAIEMTTQSGDEEKVAEERTENIPPPPNAGEQAAESSSGHAMPSAGSSTNSPRTSDDATAVPEAVANSSVDSSEKEVKPSAIGHETCPICIVDFEPGDDLRVLPCEGKHRFHQACVDPWLLELSSSCPLCREDFHAMESMMAGDEVPETEATAAPSSEAPGPAASARSSRFSKYLRFARRRNRASQVGSSSERPSTPTTHTDDS